MRTIGWSLIQHDCYPYQKGMDTCTPNRGRKMKAETGVMQRSRDARTCQQHLLPHSFRRNHPWSQTGRLQAVRQYLLFGCSVAQACPTLCDRLDCSPPGSSVQEFPRQEYWAGLSFPTARGLLNPRNESPSPALADRFLTTSTTWEAAGSLHPPHLWSFVTAALSRSTKYPGMYHSSNFLYRLYHIIRVASTCTLLLRSESIKRRARLLSPMKQRSHFLSNTIFSKSKSAATNNGILEKASIWNPFILCNLFSNISYDC